MKKPVDGRILPLLAMSGMALGMWARDSRGQDSIRRAEERLSFQSRAPWSPRIHINADVAIVYGIDASLPQRLETWRNKGYRIHVMTGVAWGQYQDYLNGKYDGVNHWDEAQQARDGSKIMHGKSTDVPYMSPGEAYGRYLTMGVRRALEAGAEALHLEEPEFWARGGYEPSFRREWKAFYGEDWLEPHSSPDAQYRASKLKYYLYRRALSQVFEDVRDYGKRTGKQVLCHVPTHSLLNYAHWRIVSPMSSLLSVGADGYIAQVWTGTARTANVHEGVRKERTFETAFLEYGAMCNLVRASGRTLWLLHDPIEDRPDYTWDDYRANWESTVVASLLHPDAWRYEVMPWPDRVFMRSYPIKNLRDLPPGTEVPRIGIPDWYETELQAVIRALGEMKQPPNRVRWEVGGTKGVGVLVSDTMMFQRADPQPSDPNLGSFYGLALPLLSRGLAVEPVQIEHITARGFLDHYRLLLLTYEGQKPPTPELHQSLSAWVKRGGALVVIDDDGDPYLGVKEWWNQPPYHYATPRQHLFSQLGLLPEATGLMRVGKGVVLAERLSPAGLTYQASGSARIRGAARRAAEAVKVPWKEAGALVLRRGPYVVAAGLESVGTKPHLLHGRFIDLFDPKLPVVREVRLIPGKRALLFDLAAPRPHTTAVAAAACRVVKEVRTANELRLQVEGIAETRAAIRLVLDRAPAEVRVNGGPLPAADWRFESGTLFLALDNSPNGLEIAIPLKPGLN